MKVKFSDLPTLIFGFYEKFWLRIDPRHKINKKSERDRAHPTLVPGLYVPRLEEFAVGRSEETYRE